MTSLTYLERVMLASAIILDEASEKNGFKVDALRLIRKAAVEKRKVALDNDESSAMVIA